MGGYGTSKFFVILFIKHKHKSLKNQQRNGKITNKKGRIKNIKNNLFHQIDQ